jgi:hypothetical protein
VNQFGFKFCGTISPTPPAGFFLARPTAAVTSAEGTGTLRSVKVTDGTRPPGQLFLASRFWLVTLAVETGW